MSKTCHITKSVFSIADKNKDASIIIDELLALPSKYSEYRNPFYLLSTEDDEVYVKNPYDLENTELYKQFFNAIDECDTNHDFKLNQSEATTTKCGFTEKEFLIVDANKDGQFENKDVEFIIKARLFYKADKDANGKLNFDEWIDTF